MNRKNETNLAQEKGPLFSFIAYVFAHNQIYNQDVSMVQLHNFEFNSFDFLQSSLFSIFFAQSLIYKDK